MNLKYTKEGEKENKRRKKDNLETLVWKNENNIHINWDISGYIFFITVLTTFHCSHFIATDRIVCAAALQI